MWCTVVHCKKFLPIIIFVKICQMVIGHTHLIMGICQHNCHVREVTYRAILIELNYWTELLNCVVELRLFKENSTSFTQNTNAQLTLDSLGIKTCHCQARHSAILLRKKRTRSLGFQNPYKISRDFWDFLKIFSDFGTFFGIFVLCL